MTPHKIASSAEWLEARKALLAKEKEFNRLRDDLSRQRRELPWERVEKTYVFDGPDGKETLADLFDGRRQLVVYHFMFGPGWEAGCKSCSFWADNFNNILPHLNARDVTLIAVSRAPLKDFAAFKQRLGWTFRWVSSFENDFNHDYHVSFTPEEIAKGENFYNYEYGRRYPPESPGISVFYKDGAGEVFHTYSAYRRGVEAMMGTYTLLDLTPKGRDEHDGAMAWVRHHDRYEPAPAAKAAPGSGSSCHT